MIAIVCAKEYILKSQRFATIVSSLKHYRKVPSTRKKTYLKTFIRKYAKLYNYLEVIRILPYNLGAMSNVDRLLSQVKPALIIIDDKLYNKVNYPIKLKESRVRRKHIKNLVTVADNLANYFGILLKDNPEKFKEELKRFEK